MSYTPNEVKVLNELNIPISPALENHQKPLMHLILAGSTVFSSGMSGPAVEALRRGLRHLNTGGYRFTQEYETLLEFNSRN